LKKDDEDYDEMAREHTPFNGISEFAKVPDKSSSDSRTPPPF
jgi:hypothetical protein